MTRAVSITILGGSLWGCSQSPPDGPPGASASTASSAAAAAAASASASASGVAGERFCDAVLTRPLERFRASCGPSHETLSESRNRGVGSARRMCADQIARPILEGRLALDADRAAACIDAVDRAGAGWIGPHADVLNLAQFPACRGMLLPRQARDEPCRTALECQDGLGCVGAKADALGTCRETAPGAVCSPQTAAFGIERRSECSSATACTPTPPGIRWGDEESKHGRLGSGPRTRPALRTGDVTVGAGLAPEIVTRIVRQSFGRFRECYETALASEPNLGGQVTVGFTVSKTGEVSAAKLVSASLTSPGVKACVVKAFYGFAFPPPYSGSAVDVVYSIKFDSSYDERAVAAAAAPLPKGTPMKPLPVELASWLDRGGGVCAARGSSGAPCLYDEACADGLVCRGTCTDARDATPSCEVHVDCAVDAYCASATVEGEPNRCAPKRSAGAECTSSWECKGYCFARECTALCGSG